MGRSLGLWTLVPCAHAAMVIWVVGEGVWRWRRGDRVLSVVHQDWVLGDVREEFSSRTIGGTFDLGVE